MASEPEISPKPKPGDGVALAYVLMAGSAIFAAVPVFGFLSWFFAIPIMIYVVIIGVRELRKGDRTHGIMLVVIGAVVYPLWVLLAPSFIISALQIMSQGWLFRTAGKTTFNRTPTLIPSVKTWLLQAALTLALTAPGLLWAQHQAVAGVAKVDVLGISEAVGIALPLQRMESVGGAHTWKVQFTEEGPVNPLGLSTLCILRDAPEKLLAGGERMRAWVIDEFVLAGERYTLLTCSEKRAMEFIALGLGRTAR